MREAEAMYPDEVWDVIEHADRLADAQAHDKINLRPPDRKGKR